MYLLIIQQELFGERQVVGIYSTEADLFKAKRIWKDEKGLRHDMSSVHHVYISINAPPKVPELYNEPLYPKDW